MCPPATPPDGWKYIATMLGRYLQPMHASELFLGEFSGDFYVAPWVCQIERDMQERQKQGRVSSGTYSLHMAIYERVGDAMQSAAEREVLTNLWLTLNT